MSEDEAKGVSSSSETALQNINSAALLLEKAKTLTEVLEIRDMATAVISYANAKGADKAHAQALELKLRAERKAGQFLKGMPKNKGASEKRTHGHDVPTLQELHIEPQESKRWQKIASIPDQKFEQYLSQTKAATQAALLHLAQETSVVSEFVESTPGKARNNKAVLKRTPKEPKIPNLEDRSFEGEDEKTFPEHNATSPVANNVAATPTCTSTIDAN